jgi:primosomal protein N' (replication factor Y)
MEERLIAGVYVDKAAYHFDQAFSYLVPAQLEETLRRGCRVLVPFGSGNRKRVGLVAFMRPYTAEDGRLKPVASQIDDEPIFGDEEFALADFLVRTTFCTWFEAVKTMMPNAFQFQVTASMQLTKPLTEEELEAYPYGERNLLRFLQHARTARELDDYFLADACPSKRSMLDALQKEGVLVRVEEAKRKRRDRTVRMARLTNDFEAIAESCKLTVKQEEVVRFLQDTQTASKEELLYFCAVGESVLKKLESRGMLEWYEREIVLPTQAPGLQAEDALPTLNEEQQDVFDGIWKLIEAGEPAAALLYGVTGSGKTSVYLRLIDAVVRQGKQAVMLVPEISLTPQIAGKFQAIFGNRVAVMHSNLSVGERMDEYKRIRRGDVSIVVGTRSAVFAPFEHIGLMILDEEAEPSYKSDAAPRYHAREVAKFRILQHKAVLLLGSATPSVESYYKAKAGVYHLFTMTKRYAGAVLPEVYLVDRTEELRQGNSSALSTMLRQELQKNLDRGEQSILFINRRGFRTAVHCLACGEVVRCPNCAVPMTYHKDNGYLMCHYCGHAVRYRGICPSCGSDLLKLTGMGTQHLEEELAHWYPTARILRMDTDTTSTKGAFTERFSAFARQEYDILLGTQMIAKGLDFPNVTLVGVLNADSGLFSPDFRGVERTFSLITQVVGRSGRAGKCGRAYLQTELPDHPVIQFAARQDYESFYQDEIESRRALMYPPFCDLCMVHFSAVREEAANRAAAAFLQILKEEAETLKKPIPLRVLGPLTPGMYRLSGKFRVQVLIKCHMNKAFRRYLRGCLVRAGSDRAFRGVSYFADCNGDLS